MRDEETDMRAGHAALQRQNPQEARTAFERAFQADPGNRDACYWLANACRMCGDPGRARSLLDSLLSRNKTDSDAAFALAFLLREQGDIAMATRVLMDLAEQVPVELPVLLKITGFLRDSNHFEESIRVCRQALKLAPDHAGLHFRMTRMLQATGQFEDALVSCRSALKGDPSLGGAWISLAQLQQFKSTQQADYQALLNAHHPESDGEVVVCTAFALGKANNDLGNWQHAFRYYTRGNRLRCKQRPWDSEQWRSQVDSAVQNTAAPISDDADDGRKPIFIIGMLRSGTTLLEQRLDRHPEISGRGELNLLRHLSAQIPDISQLSTRQRSALADELWRQMRHDGPKAHAYIDKNPLNFRFLPLINAVFPQARVIHMIRDGRDSCLSSYFQLFQHPDTDFSNNLDDLVAYYADYRRLVGHWKQIGGKLLEVRYSDLVENPAQELNRVTDYLGFSRDDAVLETGDQQRAVRTASSWQARQSLYTGSIGRWTNYRDQQPRFFEDLEAIDRRYEADS